MMKSMCALPLVAWACLAQSAPPPPAGVESEWDLQKLLQALSAGARHLKPIIEQVNPGNWKDTQAAQSYIPQWKASQSEIQYLTATAEKLAKEPERLTLVLETYFRMQAIESSVAALTEGIRKYQNPAVAELLQGALVENINNRERLKNYLVDLADTKEQEFKIMDKEAQRCRARINKELPSNGQPRSK